MNPPVTPPPLSDAALLADVQQRTFNYFWQTTDSLTGLSPDYWPETVSASIAAMGFAYTAVPIGVQHGWIDRASAAQRVRAWFEFLLNAPQGTATSGCTGYNGFFYHFLDPSTGTRAPGSEISTVDTAWLLLGVRFCRQYFNGTSADEVAIVAAADQLCDRVNWPWAQANSAAIALGWYPETGFLPYDWIGYNEALPMYILALGSATMPLGADAWTAWTSGYPSSWGSLYGIEHLTFGPMFGHQFAQVWLDLRGIQDAFMAAHGLDYFQNSARAVQSQLQYALANPLGWAGYGANVWGLSASNGPGPATAAYGGANRSFYGYAGRGVALDPANDMDDGTLTPTAVLGSLPFNGPAVTAAADALYSRYGAGLYGGSGFFSAFNPSFTAPAASGAIYPGLGWIDSRYYGINQGPILAMIENAQSGLIWQYTRSDTVLQRGLTAAGFTGGWLAALA